MRPKILDELIQKINLLPGIGKKQAERIAYHIINEDEWFSEDLEDSLKKARTKIIKCEECNNISETQICDICDSKNREKKLIVVESPMDVFKFEESDEIKAYYHVLDGLVNIQKNVNLEDLNIEGLLLRIPKYKEVILALSPNLEGIVTSNYLAKKLEGKIKVTQLAQGIPIGAAMEYVDGITLQAAIKNRKEVE